jgi:short-subunit dehydrogenase
MGGTVGTKQRWAIVTGASAGIGTALARDAAKRGYGVVLVARRRERLDALAARLRSEHGVDTVVVATDLAGDDGIEALWRETSQRNIVPDVLFNNAGFGSHKAFLDDDLSRALAMIELNCRSLVALAHRYGGAMRQRGSGTIVNVGSVLSFMPTAYMAVYAATKAFVLSFSEALSTELEGTGVAVVALCPGRTATEFADVAGFRAAAETAGGETAEQVSRTAWRAVERARPVAVSGTGNRLAATFLRHAPRGLIVRIGRSLRPS